MRLRDYLRALVIKRTSPEILEAERKAAAAMAELEKARKESATSTADALRALDAAALYARRIATETPAHPVRVVSLPDI
jgi:hypothetical protein